MQTTSTAIARSPSASASDGIVSFDVFDRCPGWERAPDWILGIIDRHQCRDILEIGSGANPTLSPSIIADRRLRYVANDVDSEELTKSDPVVDRWVGDISRGTPAHLKSRFDLVFSRMVNEHVADGRAYHSNIRDLLAPGGLSAHCFSTLYSLPFVTNRLLPERISDSILHLFDPRDRFKRAKFQAHYSWSRGAIAANDIEVSGIGI